MKLLDTCLYLLLPAVVLLHLAVAPYSKVEESFNLQAVHDVLVYGLPIGLGPAAAGRLRRFDHVAFPGAVPRTFVGAVLLAGVAQPLVAAADVLGGTGRDGGVAAQALVRAVLGLANAAALAALAAALAAVHGPRAGRWCVLLMATQFHVPFYASRTLPNTLALPLTTGAFAALLVPPGHAAAGRVRVAVCLLVLAAAVLRAEIALLLAAVAAYRVTMAAAPRAAARQVVGAGAVALAAALVLALPLDALLWQHLQPRPPLLGWAELHGFVFNVVHGRAADWGVQPWHYYATSALPRLLLHPLVPLVLLPVALVRPATRTTARLLVVPCLVFVAVYALQPHKEARFVLYVVPPLTAAAALGADELTKAVWVDRRDETTADKTDKTAKTVKTVGNKQTTTGKTAQRTRATAWLVVLGLSLALAAAASGAMLLVSALNYPGGEALAALRTLAHAHAPNTTVTAHVDVLACMTGVTLFGASLGPALPRWPSHAAGADGVRLVVDKTEDAVRLQEADFWTQFDYVVAEPDAGRDESRPSVWAADAWRPVGLVQAYAGVELLRPGQAAAATDDGDKSPPTMGHGAAVSSLRRLVRGYTGGWWLGPRMAPRLVILEQIRAVQDEKDHTV